MTRYENRLRGGPPGSEARGMVFGSLMSLAVTVMVIVLRIALDDMYANRDPGPAGRLTPGGYLLEVLSVLASPVRDLIWAVPAYVVATRRRQYAVRNGLMMALGLTAIGWFAVGPLWGPFAATVISFVVKQVDLARANKRSLVDSRRPRRPGVRSASSGGTSEPPISTQPNDGSSS